MSSPAQLALFGQPVAHSRSPAIHALFARQFALEIDYALLETAPERFEAALRDFGARGGMGANITLPLKVLAARRVDSLGSAAQRAGSVNTLLRANGGWHGENTDGAGLVADLAERHRLDLRGRRVLLIGAGGAAQAVLPALLDAGVDEIVVANRTAARADALADRIGEPRRVRTRPLAELAEAGSFELILNASAAARLGDEVPLPFSVLGPRACVYDMNYGEAAVAFLSRARAAGAAVVLDGLGMLVEQAALAFALWFGRRPDTDPVHDTLRRALDG